MDSSSLSLFSLGREGIKLIVIAPKFIKKYIKKTVKDEVKPDTAMDYCVYICGGSVLTSVLNSVRFTNKSDIKRQA